MSIPIETEEKKPRMKEEEVRMKKCADVNPGVHRITFTVDYNKPINIEQTRDDVITASFDVMGAPLPVLDLAKEIPDWRDRASGRDEISSYSLELKGGSNTIIFEYNTKEVRGKMYPGGRITEKRSIVSSRKWWSDYSSKELAISLNKEKDDYAYCAINDYECLITSNSILDTSLVASTRLLGYKYDEDGYARMVPDPRAVLTDYERYSKPKMDNVLIENNKKVLGTSSEFRVGVQLSCSYEGPMENVPGMNRYMAVLVLVASGYDEKDIINKRKMLDSMKDIISKLTSITIRVKENDVPDTTTGVVPDVETVNMRSQAPLDDITNLKGKDLMAYMDEE